MSDYTQAPDIADIVRSIDQRVAQIEAGSKGLWQIPALEHLWVNFGSGYAPASYVVDDLGFVHLRGLLKNGESGKSAFTLPAGTRPAANEQFSTHDGAGALRVVTVLGTGEVLLEGNTNGIPISGFTFLAEK